MDTMSEFTKQFPDLARIISSYEPKCGACHKPHSACLVNPCSAVCPLQPSVEVRCDGCGNEDCTC